MNTHTIDAKGKKLGRLSTEIAVLLMGKDKPAFARNVVANVSVQVVNAEQIDIPDTKKEKKEYKHYSGYPGGLRHEKMKEALDKKGIAEVIRTTVMGMLPKNKLRSKMIRNLHITS